MSPALGPQLSAPILPRWGSSGRRSAAEGGSGGASKPVQPRRNSGELAGWAGGGPLTVCECILARAPGTPCRCGRAETPLPPTARQVKGMKACQREATSSNMSPLGSWRSHETRTPSAAQWYESLPKGTRIPAAQSPCPRSQMPMALQIPPGRAGRSPGPTWKPHPVCKALTPSFPSVFPAADLLQNQGQKASIYTACSSRGPARQH